MKIGDVYRCESESFPAPANSLSRYVLIRDLDEETVTFSGVIDEQLYIDSGFLEFGSEARRMRRAFFGEQFILVKNAKGMDPMPDQKRVKE